MAKDGAAAAGGWRVRERKREGWNEGESTPADCLK